MLVAFHGHGLLDRENGDGAEEKAPGAQEQGGMFFYGNVRKRHFGHRLGNERIGMR
ncbi:hypothetical protein GGR16_000209 [Chelatococcus caeni]|uniref:Uncharacterized protein n=1 Tax=Chelatococcus caeni TaxID=1348468 RepID=A0A840BRH3_9HYPH|nr:hypothetical protein [Chelatococcus caeni]MBB4015203.1 hypothetical protein [Chelatococcus caeni]